MEGVFGAACIYLGSLVFVIPVGAAVGAAANVRSKVKNDEYRGRSLAYTCGELAQDALLGAAGGAFFAATYPFTVPAAVYGAVTYKQ